MPKKKPAEEVVADYLTHFYQHCMEYLEKEVTKDLLKLTPIDFWFTMPALWSDPAQHATRAAAEKAGFGSRADDTISMIMEPEAAAVCALKVAAGKYDDLLKVNIKVPQLSPCSPDVDQHWHFDLRLRRGDSGESCTKLKETLQISYYVSGYNLIHHRGSRSIETRGVLRWNW